MENGFVSTRNDVFPAGLRVLVVDDDPTWLKILEKMLKKCSYEVTKCCLATEALDILRKRRDGFDIVISDVNMPDMDGFKLLELVGLEMNLPVIMMSVDGEISRVMKGVLHGACDYLLKPIRMKELQNIWQHVLRKKIHEVKDIESYDGSEGIPKMRNGFDSFDDSQFLAGGDLSSPRKRKDSENHDLDDQDFSDASSAKKARVVWSIDLHQKFVSAVNQIGLDKVGPKKILDLMNVPWLTRENVASHLQKYRLYLSRLEKQGEPFRDPLPGFSFQSSSMVHQNSNATSCSFGYTGNKRLFQDVIPDVQEVNSKARGPLTSPRGPLTSPREPLTVGIPYIQNVANANMGLADSFGRGVEPNTRRQQPWRVDKPILQFSQPAKEEYGASRYIPGLNNHNKVDLILPASSVHQEHPEMKPYHTAYEHPGTNIVSTDLRSTKNQCFDQCSTSEWGSQATILGSSQSHGDMNLFSLQSHGLVENVGLKALEFSDLDPELLAEFPSPFLEGRFNTDFLFDSMEFPTIIEGLFIA
ncbi:hypothetical protein ACHQM5_010789 [Ranunculus cassubicifolius]